MLVIHFCFIVYLSLYRSSDIDSLVRINFIGLGANPGKTYHMYIIQSIAHFSHPRTYTVLTE